VASKKSLKNNTGTQNIIDPHYFIRDLKNSGSFFSLFFLLQNKESKEPYFKLYCFLYQLACYAGRLIENAIRKKKRKGKL
jgi:hypothetical protein